MGISDQSDYPRDFKGNAYVALFQDREFVEAFVRHFVDLGAIGETISFAYAVSVLLNLFANGPAFVGEGGPACLSGR